MNPLDKMQRIRNAKTIEELSKEIEPGALWWADPTSKEVEELIGIPQYNDEQDLPTAE